MDVATPALAPQSAPTSFLDDVLEGLSQPQKRLPPKYFYDERGSELFEAICRTPEYYPTRTETALLSRIAAEVAGHIPNGAALVEFGSGASDKTRILLDAIPGLSAYVPLDISAAALEPAAARIAKAYPHLRVVPIEADFTRPVHRKELEDAALVVGFFPGSTLGNFSPSEAGSFLQGCHDLLGPRSLFLIGADMVKDRETLIAAYDDAQGVTAQFNLNVLVRINAELGGDFQLDRFAHCALWNAAEARIEMHLRSLDDQTAHVAGHSFRFRRGETLHTENSHKFTVQGLGWLFEASDWRLDRYWLSDRDWFGEFLLSPA